LSREWQLYLSDLREAADKVIRYSAGMNNIEFAGNELIRDAVLRNLEIIGEAAKHIPKGVRAEVPDIDWRRIVGFRDVVAHAYFGIDEAILWDIVSAKVPQLVDALNESEK
jgi:uncharacterized protein with HEPN domain